MQSPVILYDDYSFPLKNSPNKPVKLINSEFKNRICNFFKRFEILFILSLISELIMLLFGKLYEDTIELFGV